MATSTAAATSPITATIPLMQVVASKLLYYGPWILLGIGTFGCVCNLITFTAPQLRTNSCAFYFLIATLFELSYITFGLLSSSASNLFGSTLLSTDRIYCKVRAYLVYAIGLMPTYLILLASVDRFVSSSVHARLRTFSRVKVAYRTTIGAIVIAFISCIHVLIVYDLRPRCSSLRGALAMFDSMFVVFWLGVIPHVLMLIFGFLTLANIRRTKRRIASQAQVPTDASGPNKQQRRDQKTQTQLIAMMLVQVGMSAFLVLTYVITYVSYVLRPPVLEYDRLFSTLLISITGMCFYANYAKSFYIYTLSSQLFRSIFVARVKLGMRKVLGRYHPTIFNDTRVTNIERTGGSRTRPTA